MRIPAVLSLALMSGACAAPASFDAAEGDAVITAPPPPAWSISAALPGQPLVAVVQGVPVGTTIGLAVGATYAPGQCAARVLGACVDVGPPGVVRSEVSVGGPTLVDVPVPVGAPEGSLIYAQVAGRLPGGARGSAPAVVRVVGCGDGVVGPTETCDDGDVTDGDGCDATCKPTPQTEVLTLGSALGRCGGDCRWELDVQGHDVQLTVSDHAGTSVSLVNRGRLTLTGRIALDDARRGLDGQRLDAVYGCPDCFDQGTRYLTVVQGGVASDHAYDPTTVPALLQPIEDVRTAVTDALRTCQGGAWVHLAPGCSP